MDLHPLDQLPANRPCAIQAGHGFLKDHGDVVTAHLAHLTPGQIQQVFALKQDLSTVDISGRFRHELQDGKCRHGLAAARFTDKRECFALLKDGTDPIYRAGNPVWGAKIGPQVVHLQQRLRHVMYSQAGIERIAQRIPEQIKGEHNQEERGRGRGQVPPDRQAHAPVPGGPHQSCYPNSPFPPRRQCRDNSKSTPPAPDR